jgi:hypothetical protein
MPDEIIQRLKNRALLQPGVVTNVSKPLYLFPLGSQEGPGGCCKDRFFGQFAGFVQISPWILSVVGGRSQTC